MLLLYVLVCGGSSTLLWEELCGGMLLHDTLITPPPPPRICTLPLARDADERAWNSTPGCRNNMIGGLVCMTAWLELEEGGFTLASVIVPPSSLPPITPTLSHIPCVMIASGREGMGPWLQDHGNVASCLRARRLGLH